MEHNREEELVRYGYISGTDGDKLSYAKQASEGSFIILDEHTFIHTKHIYARIPKGVNSNAIIFGLTEEENLKLPRQRWSKGLLVHFELKYSYFQRLHNALDKINSQVIAKIMPNHENFEKHYQGRYNPAYDFLKLDTYQQRALCIILNCSPEAPVLVTGPFGTGKTRLLAQAAYEILKKSPNNRVLVCAHHQASADTFVEILGEAIESCEMIRVIPNDSHHSPTRNRYDHLFVPKHDLPHSLEDSGIRLVITTLGTLVYRSKFSHILIDEGAQTREPETIGAFRFAHKWTKIIVAGDHMQV